MQRQTLPCMSGSNWKCPVTDGGLAHVVDDVVHCLCVIVGNCWWHNAVSFQSAGVDTVMWSAAAAHVAGVCLCVVRCLLAGL